MAAIPDLDLARIRKYCADRVPERALNQVRMEADVRGSSVTILECRAPWREDFGPEWSRRGMAKLKYDSANNLWTLYWADRNGRFHLFDLIEPGSVVELLAEIELDRTSIFWG